MKFSFKDFFSKCDQIRSFLRIWSHLLKKSLTENFIFCAVTITFRSEGTEQRFFGKKLIIHPNYDEKKIENDIALIQLEKPVKFSKYVQPACLPDHGYQLPGGKGYEEYERRAKFIIIKQLIIIVIVIIIPKLTFFFFWEKG